MAYVPKPAKFSISDLTSFYVHTCALNQVEGKEKNLESRMYILGVLLYAGPIPRKVRARFNTNSILRYSLSVCTQGVFCIEDVLAFPVPALFSYLEWSPEPWLVANVCWLEYRWYISN